MATGAISIDRERTIARAEQLRAYMDANVSDGSTFVCAHEQACRSSLKSDLVFSSGQLSYVGTDYDVAVDGIEFRVLVIAMDTGRTDTNVSFAQRREQILDRTREPFTARNPHMRGTTSALRILFGRTPAEDGVGEYLQTLDGRKVHLLEAYSMANLRLCSATRVGSTSSCGTPTMSRNCLDHLLATVAILEPTVIVLQGKQIRDEMKRIVKNTRHVGPALEEVEVGSVRALLASFSHPSYPATSMHWGRVKSAPYLFDTVVPTLAEARRLALHGAVNL